jgi:DNA-binding transcriptional LysR family regulator
MATAEIGTLRRSTIDSLAALRAFVAVVEAGSFSEAGYRLNVVPSTISKQVSVLEERIAGQLILRSTKRFSVTELGARLYERCLAILHEIELTEGELGAYQTEPQGRLRVTAPTSFATHYLSALLPSFMDKYPRVSVELQLTSNVLDLVTDAVDVAIRISGSLEPNLVAVKLAPNIRTFCVAPSYIERHGKPKTPQQLADHNCVLTNEIASRAKWPYMEDGAINYVTVSGSVIVDNGDMYCRSVVDGLGIGYMAKFLAYDSIQSGQLIELFPSKRVVLSHIYAVYPERRNLPLKTRAFIDHVREAFRTPPGWAVDGIHQ